MVARFSTLVNYVDCELLCEDYGDSAVVVCVDDNNELLVAERDSDSYDKLADANGKKVVVEVADGVAKLVLEDDGEVLAEAKEEDEEEEEIYVQD